MATYERDSEPEIDAEEGDEVVDMIPTNDIVQSMNLYRLNFEDEINISRKDNVRAMIEKYNLRIKDPAERYKQIVVPDDDFADVFIQTKSNEKSNALYHGVFNTPNRTTTNSITIYYADDSRNVYAQTSGTAFWVVKEYGDSTFPVKISERLLDTAGMKSHTKIPLTGNTVYLQQRSKKPERSYETGAQCLRIRFSADLRMNASIRHHSLDCFTKLDKKIRVDIGANFIHFNCDIKKTGMRNFINHLNYIHNGKATFTTDNNPEGDTDAYLQSLRKANVNETEELNRELKLHMASYIQRKEDYIAHLNGLDLCQRGTFTFAYAENFKLQINNQFHQFDGTPTLEMALLILSNRDNNGEVMVSLIDKVKIVYDLNGGRATRKLLSLIEGTMVYRGQMFNRINEEWYFMSEDHVRKIHLDFRHFLRDHVIMDGPILEKPWRLQQWEPNYNNYYLDESEFLVGDDCTYGNVELFDLLRYDPRKQHTYLYHVKKNLNGDIRILAFQIMVATDILENIHSWDDGVKRNFQTYYDSIVDKYREKRYNVPRYFDTFEKFRNLLSRKNKLTIICAVRSDKIHEEIEACDWFRVQDIYDAYKFLWQNNKQKIVNYFKENGTNLEDDYDACELIFQQLMKAGYVKVLDENNDWGYVTSKLLLANRNMKDNEPLNPQNYFRITDPCNDSVDHTIWNLVRRYSSFFESTSAKYSLMHMHKNGFNFKICQIPIERNNRVG